MIASPATDLICDEICPDHAGTPGVPAGFQMVIIAHLVKVADPTAATATAPLQPTTVPAEVAEGIQLVQQMYLAKYNTDVDSGRIQAAADAVEVRLCISNAAGLACFEH